jgi:VanZ family protein
VALSCGDRRVVAGGAVAAPGDVPAAQCEHFAIFALAGLAIKLGYPNRTTQHMAGLTLFAAAIELAQFYAPGRHPRISDFVVDALAACAGVVVALMLTRLRCAS